LNEFCKIERGKFTQRPRDDPEYYGGSYPFIQTGDVDKSNGYIQNFSQTLNEKGLSVSKLFPSGIIAITIADLLLIHNHDIHPTFFSITFYFV
jgi:type I restriction enzyme, S subunit